MNASTTHKGRTGAVLRYMLMPQILPRIGEFYAGGFSQLALLIASVYRAVNILPPNHAVFLPENRNRLGLRQVLGAAASELKYTRSDIDKVLIYFAILAGIVLLAAQFLLVLAFVMMNPALAQGQGMPTTYAGFFETPTYMGCGSSGINKESDIAYQLLYMVFGVPELFNPNCGVKPFHTALYSLLQFYSIGLLVVAVIIASYMIFAILTETAQTGVPFGKRYNQVWAPIRFVFALGLLIPTGYGLNAAQWITLYAAKFGSDFATRGWIIFNETMNDAYLSDSEQRIGWPKVPELLPLAYYMSTMSGCELAYETLYTGSDARPIEGYLVKNTAEMNGTPPTIQSKSFEQALEFYNNGDILIRFGAYNPSQNSDHLGNTRAWCGDLVIYAGDATEPGAKAMQKFYYDLVVKMWAENWSDLRNVARFQAKTGSSNENIKRIAGNLARPSPKYRKDLANALESFTEKALEKAVQLQRESNTWKNDAKQIKSRGWGGAGIWYNKIAQVNGSLVTAVNNVPQPRNMPQVWEYSKAKMLQQNTNPDKGGSDKQADDQKKEFDNGLEEDALEAINAVYNYWTREDMRQDEKANQTRQTNNIIIDVINMIFGTSGLFDMCKSADVHPLAQLSILGKGLVEASIRNLALAVGGSVLAAAQIPFIGVAAGAASKMLLTVAGITITLGFILFYVLPFMPFLYFFFAVGGWIKGLFEAMVGVPLWALAHMRIDGEGLPGEAAISGYFMIFEIFLRPIVIVFGLLASVVIFAAMVKVLNEIFYLVVVNLAGHDESSRTLCGQIGNNGGAGSGGSSGGGSDSAANFFRGPIDELFFTVLYAIIVYMIGMSCFKLIDLVPKNLLRYMNANVATFNDQRDDPAAGLLTRLSIGGRTVFGQVMDIGGKAGDAVSNLGKGAVEIASSGQPREGG